MSCERALNFDHWKTFSENYKQMRVWLWLVYKFTENCQIYRLFSDFIQTQKRYPIFLDKIHTLTWKLLYQVKIFLVNLTPKELTPYKISHIWRCTFKDTRRQTDIWRQTDVKFWPLLSIRKFLVLTWIGPWVEFRNPTLLQGSKVRVKISKWRD